MHPHASSLRAEANRRHILDVALVELLRSPDASMNQIALAAGLSRRTVYGHFTSRDALVAAIIGEAIEAVEQAHAAGREGVADPAEALARSLLAVWKVVDRYRLLLSLAQQSLTMEGIRDRLGAVHGAGTQLIQRALEEGSFSSPLPPEGLRYVLEGVLFSMMEATNNGQVRAEEAGYAVTVTLLCAAGMPHPRAAELVARILDE
ncbi:TetR/AcrR family transcriptional regulator [Streptomyces sp. NPDC057245]|uniref:TetR/AcrR family transcriptional regulator n=1 Tax=Streptomyces TaxID=1883 RepID=UPI001C1E8D85|nr:TetR/AcrR family transcriptional regulator [Streptomyces sp. A108]MBU6533785.1 TetR/AcrR family transcriptional regulator [Streptomyces sp. A108]